MSNIPKDVKLRDLMTYNTCPRSYQIKKKVGSRLSMRGEMVVALKDHLFKSIAKTPDRKVFVELMGSRAEGIAMARSSTKGYVTKLRNQARKYADSLYDAFIDTDEYEVLSVQRPFNFVVSGLPVEGKVDIIVERKEDKVLSFVKIAFEEQPDNISVCFDLENHIINKHLIGMTLKDRTVGILMVYNCPDNKLYSCKLTEEQEQAIADNLEHIAKGIMNEDFHIRGGGMWCRSCQYLDECPVSGGAEK